MKAFEPLAERSRAATASINSLAQTVLKLTVPGVPDIYQGCEIWDFSLVDPDNRRPVDYAARRAMLDSLNGDDARADLLANVAGWPGQIVRRRAPCCGTGASTRSCSGTGVTARWRSPESSRTAWWRSAREHEGRVGAGGGAAPRVEGGLATGGGGVGRHGGDAESKYFGEWMAGAFDGSGN